MKVIVLLVVCCVAFVSSQTYDVIEDGEGTQFYLVPLRRQRRQTKVDIDGGGGGATKVTLGHTGTLFKNERHQLTGDAFASKQFNPSGPTTLGGQLGYTHIPSGSSLNAGVARTGRFGTDLNLQGKANLWRRGDSRLDAVGEYSRHFGGLGGTGRPNYYVGAQFVHRF